MGDSRRKSSSSADVGGPAGIPARTPPSQPSPTFPFPPEPLPQGQFDNPPSHELTFQNFRKYTILDALFMLTGIVTYIADIVTDILAAVQYFLGGDYWWAGFTFVFICVPSMTLQYFSLRWFVLDLKEENLHHGKGLWSKVWSWVQWVLFHLFQLGAVKRYWRTLKYGWRTRKGHKDDKMRYYRMMVYEYRDITMLRLLEAFMESAPQLVLQLYIIKRSHDLDEEIHWITGISALVSLSSLSWGLEAYHKALRDSRSDKKKISYFGVFIRISWRTLTITSRVISMALFASYYKWIIFPIMGCHWLVMTIWLIWQKTDFCTTLVEEYIFDGVIGVVHIFSFFNMKEGRTRYRATFFYILIFVENTVMFALWYHDDGDPKQKWYSVPALVFVWGGFFLGILIMITYYSCFHPNGRKHLCKKGKDSTQSVESSEKVQMQRYNYGVDEVDGKTSGKRSRIEGNLFVRQGRRHLPDLDLKGTKDANAFKVVIQQGNDVNHSNSASLNHQARENGEQKVWTETVV